MTKKNQIEIRPTTTADLPQVMSIYESARRFMRSRGNMEQWTHGYPSEDLIRNEIAKGVSYVGLVDGKIEFVFSLIIGEDPTYRVIEGQWLNDSPYGTIHRLASSGAITGVVKCCVDYALTRVDNLRIDTHEQNLPMRQAVERIGFLRCGIIYVADGTPRVAYQLPR